MSASGPSGATCEALRLWLGAYALGTLEPADQDLVEAHLASCPACLAELAELAAVVPVLATLSSEDLEPAALPPELFGRIVDAVDAVDGVDAAEPPSVLVATQRSVGPPGRSLRSRRWLLTAAAAVVVLAGAGTAIGFAVSSPSGSSRTTAEAVEGAVHLRVAATDAPAGTRLQLTVRGLPRNEHCHLVAVAADSSRHDAGTWDATYGGRATVIEATDVSRSDLRRLILYSGAGKRLVAVHL